MAPLGLDANAVLRSDDLRLDPRVITAEGQLIDPRAVVVGKPAALQTLETLEGSAKKNGPQVL